MKSQKAPLPASDSIKHQLVTAFYHNHRVYLIFIFNRPTTVNKGKRSYVADFNEEDPGNIGIYPNQ